MRIDESEKKGVDVTLPPWFPIPTQWGVCSKQMYPRSNNSESMTLIVASVVKSCFSETMNCTPSSLRGKTVNNLVQQSPPLVKDPIELV